MSNNTNDIPEVTHYPSLDLGLAHSSRMDLHIVGLELHIYGLEEIKESNLPIAAVIATHGRCNNKKQMGYFAHGLLGHLREVSRGKKRRRDVIVVTLDQRNHGTRVHDKRSNLAYDENPRHLLDMASTIVGGCQDVSLVIDFLAPYLFPDNERIIEEYIPTGVSLGGNVTWRLLRVEPRVRIAIPIIGLPFESFRKYLGARAEAMGLAFEPPLYPTTLRPLLESPVPEGCYEGKEVLSIHGELDELVPIAQGKEDIKAVVESAKDGDVVVWVQEGAGHVVTTQMVERTAEWIYKWAVAEEDAAVASL